MNQHDAQASRDAEEKSVLTLVPDGKGSDNMSERQKQLVEDITSNIEKLPIEKQYQLLGVAQGMGMTPQPQAAKTEEK